MRGPESQEVLLFLFLRGWPGAFREGGWGEVTWMGFMLSTHLCFYISFIANYHTRNL